MAPLAQLLRELRPGELLGTEPSRTAAGRVRPARSRGTRGDSGVSPAGVPALAWGQPASLGRRAWGHQCPSGDVRQVKPLAVGGWGWVTLGVPVGGFSQKCPSSRGEVFSPPRTPHLASPCKPQGPWEQGRKAETCTIYTLK